MSTNFECPICCIDYTNETDIITCQFCGYKCCLNCAKKWLIEQITEYKCINPKCNKIWSIPFIYNNFPIKFINGELKNNYAEICFIIDRQQHTEKYKNIYNFCNNINYVFKIFYENNINISDYMYYCQNYGIFISFDKIQTDKLHKIAELYQLFKEYINYNTFLSIFSLYDKHLYKLFNMFLCFNIINKDNIFNIPFEQVLKYYSNYIIINSNDDIYNKLVSDNLINSSNETKLLYKYNYYLKNYTPYQLIQKILYYCKYYEIDKMNNNTNNIRKFYKCFKLNCDGDILKLKTQLKCNKCKSIFCTKCGVEIFPKQIEYLTTFNIIETKDNINYDKYTDEQKQHKCKQQDIDNLNYLIKDTKFCPNPNCGVPIKKNGGCDHMACTKCWTFFNWSDLKITKTTTNALGLQHLREIGAIIPRYDHPDAQPYNLCDEQLSYSQCIRIKNKYLPNNIKYTNFIKLLELKIKPPNTEKIDTYRKKLIFKLITEEQYKKYITTLYISKYFIDNYNAIISNTIFMISELFKHIRNDGLNSKLNYELYDKEMNEIVNIHNDALHSFNKLYSNFRIQIIDNDYNTKIYLNDTEIKSKRLILKTKYDENNYYFNSPIKNENEQIYYTSIYNIFLSYYYPKLKNKDLLLYFPSYCILNNTYLYELLTNEIIFDLIFNKHFKFKLSTYNKYKDIFKNISAVFIDIINKCIIYLIHNNIKITIDEFKLYYNKLLHILENSDNTYEKIIYTDKLMTNKIYLNVFIDRIKRIQKDLYLIYKYDKSSLIENFNKYNLNSDTVVNMTIFNKDIQIYSYILSHENDIINIFNLYKKN